jgi:hypothetical protein
MPPPSEPWSSSDTIAPPWLALNHKAMLRDVSPNLPSMFAVVVT